MLTNIVKTQRRRIADQLPEHPTPSRQNTDLRSRPFIDTHSDEPLKLRSRVIQQPNRRIPRARQLTRRRQRPIDHDIQIELLEHTAREL